MQATIPSVEIPGDNESRVMARDGRCIGMSDRQAVWRFGYIYKSQHALAHGVTIQENLTIEDAEVGYLWVLATRRTGKVRSSFRGYAIDLPHRFKQVINWLPN